MCYRFYLDTENDAHVTSAVNTALSFAAKYNIEMKCSGDIYPTNIVPVIAPSATSRKPIVFPMRWGFDHPKRDNIFVFNTRCETATEKDLFITSTEERRCLIPVSGYYEWKKLSKTSAEKYAFSAPVPLYLAGLYVRSSKAPIPSFSVLTMNATEAIKPIHARMPVVLTENQQEGWLGAKLPIKDAFQWSGGKDELVATALLRCLYSLD